MIAYLKGTFVQKNPTNFIVETASGVAYSVHISLHTFSQIQQATEGQIYTYLHIKEDSHTLYGFAQEDEKELFLYLISISGIGPSTAQVMLSSLNPSEIRQAIVQENENLIRSIKGIGQKTAKLIILELKDKLAKSTPPGDISLPSNSVGHRFRDEALNALLALGIAKPIAQKALNKVLTANPAINSIESLIKQALQVV